MSKKLILKKIITLSLFIVCLNCTKKEKVYLQSTPQGGQDSGGGSTSLSNEDQIKSVFNSIESKISILTAVLLEIAREKKYEKLKELYAYFDEESLWSHVQSRTEDLNFKLSFEPCEIQSKKPNDLICVYIPKAQQIPTDSLYEEISIALVREIFNSKGMDDLDIASLQLFARKNMFEILERLYFTPSISSTLKKIFNKISIETNKLKNIDSVDSSYNSDVCDSLSKVNPYLKYLDIELKFLDEYSQKPGANKISIQLINTTNKLKVFSDSCVNMQRINSSELKEFCLSMELFMDQTLKHMEQYK